MSSESAKAYFLSLEVAEADEAASLELLLRAQSALVERDGSVLSVLWPAASSDVSDEVGADARAALGSFLRGWAGDDPRRELTVLEERRVAIAGQMLRRVS